jgi:hypothetical protein
MTTKALQALPSGSYVSARINARQGLETVRFSHVAPPTSEERRFGRMGNYAHVRRFLVGGYLDIRLDVREVVAPIVPSAGTLANMEMIENEVGPKAILQ